MLKNLKRSFVVATFVAAGMLPVPLTADTALG